MGHWRCGARPASCSPADAHARVRAPLSNKAALLAARAMQQRESGATGVGARRDNDGGAASSASRVSLGAQKRRESLAPGIGKHDVGGAAAAQAEALAARMARLRTENNELRTRTMQLAAESRALWTHFEQLLKSTEDSEIEDTSRPPPSLILLATAAGSASLVRRLAALGSHFLREQDEDGRTALMLAARNGHTAIVEALVGAAGRAGTAVAADLLAATDVAGRTPLMLACQEGALECVGLLLSRARALACTGVLDAQDDAEGFTALHHAAAHGRADCVRILISAGASRALEDSGGWTALNQAEFAGHQATIAAFS